MLNKLVLFYIFASTFTMVAFQNCTKTDFAQLSTESASSLPVDWCVTYPSAAECIKPSKSKCIFNGNIYSDGQTVTAYLSSNGSKCISEVRVCRDGNFTGSYNYSSCAPNGIAACLFNGQTLASEQTVTSYQNSSVPFGKDCLSEDRICHRGLLSGTFSFDSCSVGLPFSCRFNGQTVAHGNSVTAFTNSTVVFGQNCQSALRTCYNGLLSGSGNFGSCNVGAPAACLFNGQTIPHNGTVSGYLNSTVPFGSQCVSESRICTNGTLAGTYTFGSCKVGAPASCTFNGQTIVSGQVIKSYQNSSVLFGQTCVSQDRLCTNGNLSGGYNFGSCSVGAPAACLFNGQNVSSGQIIKSYQNSSVAYGQKCVAEDRVCTNGNLSGSYNFGSCSVGAGASCLFNGQNISSGQIIKSYQNSSVLFGQLCVSQDRVCTNGTLSGSYNFGSCSAGAAASCSFNGQTLASGQTVKSYQNSSVLFGQSCVSQNRICTNGTLSGSYNFGSCSAGAAASCLFNGQSLASGQTVKSYQSSTVAFGRTCISQDRLCTNGNLSGSYNYGSCSSGTAASCLLDGRTIAHNESVQTFNSRSVSYGQSCQSLLRLCNNGSLDGNSAFQFLTCAPSSGLSCNFKGQAVSSGSSVLAFLATSVPYGQSCQSENRVCTNGNLSGSYDASSCSQQSSPAASCSVSTNLTSFRKDQSLTAYVSSVNVTGVQSQCTGQSTWFDIYNGQTWGSNTFGPGNMTCSFRGINQYNLQPVNCNPSQITFNISDVSVAPPPPPSVCSNGATNYPACNNRSCNAGASLGVLCLKICKGIDVGQRNTTGYLINSIASGSNTNQSNVATNVSGTHYHPTVNHYNLSCNDGNLRYIGNDGWCEYHVDQLGVDAECDAILNTPYVNPCADGSCGGG